jgi:hypothetical protein
MRSYADNRPQRAPAPRRAAAHHRSRRAPDHRVRHQHLPRQLAHLERRHRRRARAEDRIRCANDTGLANLPLHDVAQNEIWCAIVALAADLVAWLQTLTLTGHEARRWEPKRLRLRLVPIPARHAATGRRRLLHLAAAAPFTTLALHALAALARLTASPAAAPGSPGPNRPTNPRIPRTVEPAPTGATPGKPSHPRSRP